MSPPAAAATVTTRQIAGVPATAIRSRIFAAAALAPAAGDKTVTRKHRYCAQAKTVQVLPRALRIRAAGSCATTVTAARAAGVRAGDLQHNTSSNSDTTPSSGSVSSRTNRSGGSDVEGICNRSGWPRKGGEHGRTRWWAPWRLRVGSCCSHVRCPRCSNTLTGFGHWDSRWMDTFTGQRPSPLSLWVSSSSPPSLSACTGFLLYEQPHWPSSSSYRGVFRPFYASLSFLGNVPQLSFSPHFLSGFSAPLQTARRCQELYTPSPFADFCLSLTAVSALLGYFSMPTSSSLHCRYSSQSFRPGVWYSSAALTQNFVAFYSSSASRRSFSAVSSPRTPVSHETSSSLLQPIRLWPCAQQLHTSLLLSVLQRGEIAAPTDVQERSVPSLLAGESSLIVAPTGSGKTLAWALPLLSSLLHADRERLAPYARQPRLLVLVPSRELAQQLLQELRKHFSSAGVSIASATAGQSYVKEVRALVGGGLAGDGSTTGADVLITTPARLLLHLHKRNINLRRVRAVVVEEADTLCDTFYEQELLLILNALLRAVGGSAAATLHATAAAAGCTAVRGKRREGKRPHYQRELEFLDSHLKREFPAVAEPEKQQTSSCGTSKEVILPKRIAADAERPPVQLVFVAATKTGALGRFLRRQLEGLPLTCICAPDAHMTNPGVQQVFVPLGGEDRLSRLLEVLDEKAAGAGGARGREGATADGKKTIIFCNTVNSCRAVDLTLVEKGYRVSCLHGMMPFKLRKTSFQRFKGGQTDILVCTNVASRGLDINGVEHVIMFDFPQSLADYLHRSGRTARGGETGRVTLLFSKKNLPLIHQIQNISKATLSSPELRHASHRVRRLLRLEERWRELVNMSNPKRKIGGRRKLGLPPNRNAVGPKTKWILKKLHFRMKAISRMKFLRSRGILLRKELLPRHPRLSVERSDAQQCMRMIRGEDGLLQVIPARRSKYFMRRKAEQSEQGQYERSEETIPIDGRSYVEEKAARPSKYHRRTYF